MTIIGSNVGCFSGNSSSTDSNVSKSVNKSNKSFCTIVEWLYSVIR